MTHSIWNPSTVQEAIDMANLLTAGRGQDLIVLHANFGHHFDGDMGRLMSQANMIQGQPTLTADAMAGICRRSGLCRYIQITEWTDRLCTVVAARTDEPADITHEFTFSWEMATAQGLTNKRPWQKMPKQMLRARAMTMALRSVFPDAVSGVYSADEIADNKQMSEDEHEAIAARALGEELPSRRPQPRSAAPRQQQRSAAPQQQPPQQQQQIEPNRLYDFSTEEGWQKALKGWGLELSDAMDLVAHMVESPTALTPSQKEELFYSRLAARSMRDASIPTNWFTGTMDQVKTYHQNLYDQFSILKYMLPKWFGPRMACGAWMETLKLAQAIQMKERQEKAVEVLKTMHPLDWTAYDFVQSLLDEDMELGSH